MGDRADLPRIKPTEAPSMFNYDAGKWGAIGRLAAIVPAMFAKSPGVMKGIMAAGTIIGAVYGGITGKAQQEKEAIEGRVVKDPGYFNKGLVTGVVVAVMLFPIPFIGLPLGIAALVTGSVMRNNSLQRDFDRAIAIRDQQQAQATAAAQGMGRGQQQGYMNSVNPAEAAELASKQKTTASHADAVSQQAAQQTAAAR